MKHKHLLTSIVIAYSSLTGFIFGNAESDVNDFLRQTEDQTKASTNLNLSPLPEMRPHVAYAYQSGAADPFKLKAFVSKVTDENAVNSATAECTSSECSASAPVPHTPYYLESYELNTLQMTGTMLAPNKQVVALVKTPDSGIQEARVGEYIGRNNGLILSIKPDHIVIQEKYRVPRGWQDRMATLELF